MAVLTGKAAFINLTETEQYQGQDTGRYTLTVTLDEDTAQMCLAKASSYETTKDSPT